MKQKMPTPKGVEFPLRAMLNPLPGLARRRWLLKFILSRVV